MLSNTFIHTTATTLFLATGEQALTTMFFCNQSLTTSTTVDIYAVPGGIAYSSSNLIMKALSLPATETFVFDAEKLILANGDSIVATSAYNDIVVATISSVQTA